ncbi:MAG: threonylcarbamoyl-AMP synthase [Pyrinomonadaceae bacterium]|nr:threonylcarbamoyl-AMP synthase [Phycisphaerales bacterium]
MSPTIQEIKAAAAILRQDKVVAFPTETVYGLGAHAFSPAAVARVFALKGRPSFNPLIVHVSGPDMARRVVSSWPDAARQLAMHCWPGPLSIVLPKHPDVPESVTGGPGSTSVAVRCPDHPIALALLYEFGAPLVGPSANLSGTVSPTTADHVRTAFSSTDVLVLDGGPCATGIESTVISLMDPIPRLLRPGVVSAEELTQVLGITVESSTPAQADSTVPLPSPGMLSRHYAPRTPTTLFDTPALASQLSRLSAGARAVILARDPLTISPPHLLIPMPGDPAAYAARLYAAFHEADQLQPTILLVQTPPSTEGVWQAIWDRLKRASAT